MSEIPFNADYVEFTCDKCEEPIIPGKEVACICSKYGAHHEGVYCSEDCLFAGHELE